MLTLIESDRFGTVAMIEIGAFTVGSIRQQFEPGVPYRRGDHKGYFELGGSTVVLLFQPGAIRLDEDLCTRSRMQMESYVRLGESLGRL
jgi:phosphatidylserine decarboxylase